MMKTLGLIVGASLVFASWVAVPSVAADTNPGAGNEGQRLKRNVLDARRSLRDGRAEFTTVDPTGREVRYSAWFKGTERLRVDETYPMHENKMLRVEEDLFDWTKSPGGPILQPERRQLDDPNGAVFDFRLLGTVFSSPTAFHSYDFGDHLASGVGTVRAEVERVELNSRELQLITTDYPTGSVLRQWIDIERGPSIVQAELEGDSPSRHYLDRVVSRLQNYAGVWFPDQVVFTRFVDRRPVGSSYVTTLHKAEFNTGLKDDLFTLGALGVPAGTNVKEFPPFPEGQRIWDGEKLVVKSPKKRQYVNLKVPLKANGGWRSILLWTNALAGAGCLALFTYRTIRRRQTSS